MIRKIILTRVRYDLGILTNAIKYIFVIKLNKAL